MINISPNQMPGKYKFLFGLLILFFTFSALSPLEVFAEVSSTPTILSTSQIEEGPVSQIQVRGLVIPGNDVLIYINGKYDGLANISDVNTDYSKFVYISLPQNSNQPFEVMAVAQTQESHQLSAPTSVKVISVIEKSSLESADIHEHLINNPVFSVAPPILKSPRPDICFSNLYISGFASSGSMTRIFIDEKLSTSILISNQSSSSSFFSYSPPNRLSRGRHSVYAVSEYSSGTKSIKSNIISFCINSPSISSTTTTANIDGQGLTASNLDTPTSSASLVSQKTNNLPANTGHRNTLNILIFIIFIVGLIVWMFLVNKELGGEPINSTGENNTNSSKPA